MISLTHGKRVAEFQPHVKHQKPINIFVNTDNTELSQQMKNPNRALLLPKTFFSNLKNVSLAQIELLKTALNRKAKNLLPSNNKNLLNNYDTADVMLDELEKKQIVIDSKLGHFQVCPDVENDAWFGHTAVFGASGSGKSTWIGNFVKRYTKQFPETEVLIFSPIRDDEALKKLNAKYIKIDESIVEEPLSIDEFVDSILIFDDIESINNKKFKEAIIDFRDQVLETGRHKKICAICVSHIILGGQSTKKILNECGTTVLFPHSNFNGIRNLLTRYYGMDKDNVSFVKDTPSRWVCVKRDYPTTIITENSVKIL